MYLIEYILQSLNVALKTVKSRNLPKVTFNKMKHTMSIKNSTVSIFLLTMVKPFFLCSYHKKMSLLHERLT